MLGYCERCAAKETQSRHESFASDDPRPFQWPFKGAMTRSGVMFGSARDRAARRERPTLGASLGIAKSIVAPVAVLCLGLTLGSCSSFSGYVADHWPRWAGGMPDDVPPRPGAPGYDEFVAHGQPSNVAARPAATDVKPASAGVKTDAAPIPAQEQSANAPNAVQRGGLY